MVRGETVVGSQRHVFDFGDVGAGAVGEDVDAFRRQLEVALREYSAERGEPGIDAAARMTADVAETTDVVGIVAARDGEGEARVLSFEDGVLEERVAARGSAARLVLGQLESLEDPSLSDAEAAVREAFDAAAERDTGTGGELDLWRLEDAEPGETV